MTDFFRRKAVAAAAVAFFIAPLIPPASASEKSERLYKQGKFAEAVAASEEEYARTGDDGEKAELIRYLTELGLDMSFKENYNAAEYAFSRALSLSPDDLTLKELKDTVKDLGSYPARETVPEKEVKAAEPPPATRPAPAPAPFPLNGVYIKQQLELIRKLEKLASAIEKKSSSDSGISEETVQKTALSINRTISESMSSIKLAFVLTALAVTAAAALLVFAAFLIARYAVNKHHSLVMAAQKPMGLKQKARRIPLIYPDNDTKYEGIGIIEAELSSEDSTESSVARTLLEPFLNDSDIELKIRAIKALHKYSADEAVGLLEQEAPKGLDGIKIFCRLIQLMSAEKSLAIAAEVMKKADPEGADLLNNALIKLNSPALDAKLRDKLNALTGISGKDDLIIG
ncbi:hypothetical protein KKF70_01395 [bacterium]|nr:hypothetical protein [Candidatus Omnitrophota bacterium]MBU2528029.1 hypothetical protein [bacterium]MBU3930197.1 hypothetical protein [bacterium]MBU4123554.1 hypothetical protein [bacterium]